MPLAARVVRTLPERAILCTDLLFIDSAISNETGYIIYTTKIRVHQDETVNVVDTTR